MRTPSSSHYRHSPFHDIERELPFLVIGACTFAVTIIAVYLYAAMQ